MYCVLFWHFAMPVGLAYIGEMGGFGILCRKGLLAKRGINLL